MASAQSRHRAASRQRWPGANLAFVGGIASLVVMATVGTATILTSSTSPDTAVRDGREPYVPTESRDDVVHMLGGPPGFVDPNLDTQPPQQVYTPPASASRVSSTAATTTPPPRTTTTTATAPSSPSRTPVTSTPPPTGGGGGGGSTGHPPNTGTGTGTPGTGTGSPGTGSPGTGTRATSTGTG